MTDEEIERDEKAGERKLLIGSTEFVLVLIVLALTSAGIITYANW